MTFIMIFPCSAIDIVDLLIIIMCNIYLDHPTCGCVKKLFTQTCFKAMIMNLITN